MFDSQRFSEWIQSVQGQYINVDGAYGAQCWDLAAHFAAFMGLPVVNTGGAGRWPGWAGNMYDAYPQNDAIAAAYERIPADQPGQPGDTVIWDDSFWYYPKTHVAVLVLDKGPQKLCMSQNSTPSQPNNPYPGDSTGPTTLQYLPSGGLLGYLRPRMGLAAQGGITQPIQEDDMALTDEQARTLAYIGSAQFKADIFAGTTQLEKDARAAFHKEALNQGVDWYGYDGKIPAQGRRTTSPAIDLGFADTRAMGQTALIAGLIELVKHLSEKQGITVDLDAIRTASAAGVKDAIESITTTVKIEG